MHADPDPVLVAYSSAADQSHFSFISVDLSLRLNPEQLTVRLRRVMEQALSTES